MWVGARAGGRDHPRSRGVYQCGASTRSPGAGSSPLARGLHRVPPHEARVGRIIPARAGFTRGRPRCAPGPCGSSPLARGLRGPRHERHPGPGIIPARAGFTQSALASAVSHPGSSPLARGLPTENWNQLADARIIPARAGFTYRRVPGGSSRRDHPRSRGVYARRWRRRRGGRGSSPLARGLRGFDRTSCAGDVDHPRSRGVYRLLDARPGRAVGSSPLARGLPERPSGRLSRGRIIPARAGFTPPPAGSWSPRTDHPRSRGVYPKPARSAGRRMGSSPLARGLLLRPGLRPGRHGIIPARAGFTYEPDHHARHDRDHPRSRGVYSRL